KTELHELEIQFALDARGPNPNPLPSDEVRCLPVGADPLNEPGAHSCVTGLERAAIGHSPVLYTKQEFLLQSGKGRFTLKLLEESRPGQIEKQCGVPRDWPRLRGSSLGRLRRLHARCADGSRLGG